MAIARKCDRCGKYYDKNKKYGYDLVMGTVIGLRFETLQGFNSSRIDLCDECLGKIISWHRYIKGKGMKE